MFTIIFSLFICSVERWNFEVVVLLDSRFDRHVQGVYININISIT